MPPRKKNIVCFGDSLTAGYGLSSSQAYPALLQQKIDASGLPYYVVNAGVNGDTSAKGVLRIENYLDQPIDVLLLALGINDLPRGIAPQQIAQNLQKIIDRVREKNPNSRLVLAGMEIPNMIIPGMDISSFISGTMVSAFRTMYQDLAGRNGMAYIPFLLEGVAGKTHLNLYDRIHPNAEGHKIMVKTVWEVLSAVL